MMRRTSVFAMFAAVTFSLSGFASAQELSTLSDLDLLAKTREAVALQDAELVLDLMTEMEGRGVGLFARSERAVCEEVIVLPDGITDWKFHSVARQAYIRVAMSRRLETSTCGCLFADFSFDEFVWAVLGKRAADLTDADRDTLATVRDKDRRTTEAQFRDLEQSCLAQ
jgi:hypothetical protein